MVTLSDLKGSEYLAGLVRENVVEAVKSGKEGSNRVVIYGPPGNGKTFLAKAIAGELGYEFKDVKAGEIDEGLPDVQGKTLLFLDEFEKFMDVQEIRDSIEDLSEDVLVVGGTNHPWNIQGLSEAGFNSLVFMPEPGPEARKAVLREFLGDGAVSLDLDRLAEMTDGFLPVDIHNTVEAMDEITQESLEERFGGSNPTTLQEWMEEAITQRDRLDRTAYKPLLEWLDKQ
ncbi:MAG: AAA family ATPase [Candidatus Altiarchaeales archaeon]|nr:AAA family ATPase [Candidatus Altiarchaeales archaeon]MBD3415907.1 AAA family ATPase [Candidatus Altiarchaeales archaeon]